MKKIVLALVIAVTALAATTAVTHFATDSASVSAYPNGE